MKVSPLIVLITLPLLGACEKRVEVSKMPVALAQDRFPKEQREILDDLHKLVELRTISGHEEVLDLCTKLRGLNLSDVRLDSLRNEASEHVRELYMDFVRYHSYVVTPVADEAAKRSDVEVERKALDAKLSKMRSALLPIITQVSMLEARQ